MELGEAELLTLQDHVLEAFAAVEGRAVEAGVVGADQVADQVPVGLVGGRDYLQVERQLDHHLECL